MNQFNQPTRQVVVRPTTGLYKWSSIFNHLQRNFFVEPTKLRREKQIEDFVLLNEYQQVYFITDTDVLQNIRHLSCDNITQADLVVLTDQRYSRYPCPAILEQINNLLQQVPALYICLNRHYINIDNSYHDHDLDKNFCLAITQWLRRGLDHSVVDLSLNYTDYGQSFSWALPDRHYLITRAVPHA